MFQAYHRCFAYFLPVSILIASSHWVFSPDFSPHLSFKSRVWTPDVYLGVEQYLLRWTQGPGSPPEDSQRFHVVQLGDYMVPEIQPGSSACQGHVSTLIPFWTPCESIPWGGCLLWVPLVCGHGGEQRALYECLVQLWVWASLGRMVLCVRCPC